MRVGSPYSATAVGKGTPVIDGSSAELHMSGDSSPLASDATLRNIVRRGVGAEDRLSAMYATRRSGSVARGTTWACSSSICLSLRSPHRQKSLFDPSAEPVQL